MSCEDQINPVPIIVDTDLGDDIDDTWALAFLLSLPQYAKILLISTSGKGNHRKRAAIICKICQRAGRDEIPIVCGIDQSYGVELAQLSWLNEPADNILNSYSNFINNTTAAEHLVHTIMQSKYPVTIMAIGPMYNIAAALNIEPDIANRAHFVSMAGSIYKGYGNSEKPAAEFNIAGATDSAKIVFKAKWISVSIIPDLLPI
jgi:inosine-uridine nucleoside N-ribohydrolase